MTWKTKLRAELTDLFDKSDRPIWELTDPLVWGDSVVPAGFRTNYASIPRLPIVFLAAGDRAHKEAAWHDYQYTVRKMSRKQADDTFLEMLLVNPKIPAGLAYTMHRAVRWFGNGAWEDSSNVPQQEEILSLIEAP